MIESKLTTLLLNVLIELDDKSPALPSEISHCFTDMPKEEAQDILNDLVGYGLATKNENGKYSITNQGECIAINY